MTPAGSSLVPTTSGSSNALAPRQPTIGLVLGGGGARGLAHVLMLEVFDELKIKPSIIAGTSIGAIFGAAYASGLTAAEIRAHTQEALTRRLGLIRGLVAARAQGTGKLWNLLAARAQLLAPEALLDLVLPHGVARDFGDLAIPLRIVASDYYALEQAVFSTGPLRPAIAASIALPVIFEPVEIGGRTLIDGGLTNPLPFDVIKDEADIIVAIDVLGRDGGVTEALAADGARVAVRRVVFVRALDRAREAQVRAARHLHRRWDRPLSGARIPESARNPRCRGSGESAA